MRHCPVWLRGWTQTDEKCMWPAQHRSDKTHPTPPHDSSMHTDLNPSPPTHGSCVPCPSCHLLPAPAGPTPPGFVPLPFMSPADATLIDDGCSFLLVPALDDTPLPGMCAEVWLTTRDVCTSKKPPRYQVLGAGRRARQRGGAPHVADSTTHALLDAREQSGKHAHEAKGVLGGA